MGHYSLFDNPDVVYLILSCLSPDADGLEIYQEEQRVLYWELEDFQDKDSLVFTREGLLEEGEWKPEELTLEGLRVEFYEPEL